MNRTLKHTHSMNNFHTATEYIHSAACIRHGYHTVIKRKKDTMATKLFHCAWHNMVKSTVWMLTVATVILLAISINVKPHES